MRPFGLRTDRQVRTLTDRVRATRPGYTRPSPGSTRRKHGPGCGRPNTATELGAEIDLSMHRWSEGPLGRFGPIHCAALGSCRLLKAVWTVQKTEGTAALTASAQPFVVVTPVARPCRARQRE